MSLDEVQIAYFERVQYGLRNFDLVFIFNDWSQKEVHINGIPINSLEPIKEWLNSVGIKYYQGKANLRWRSLLDTFAKDPVGFWEEGGWSRLDDDEDEDEEEEAPPAKSTKRTKDTGDAKPAKSSKAKSKGIGRLGGVTCFSCFQVVMRTTWTLLAMMIFGHPHQKMRVHSRTQMIQALVYSFLFRFAQSLCFRGSYWC